MKRTIRKYLAAAGLMLLPALAGTVYASHFQGSELTYTCVAPNMYMVKYKVYRDCSGVAAPNTMVLNLKSAGCATPRQVTLTRTGSPVIGNGYCPQISPGCGTSSPYPNYEEITFQTTVTFTAAEAQCPDWLLSVSECCRPQSANLANATSGSLYSESYLNLAVGVNNNSPQFGSLVVPYISYNKPIQLSAFASDADGDSLAYSMVLPMTDLAVPMAYKSRGVETIYNGDSTKWAVAPAGTYSATFPVHSFEADWNQPMPLTATPQFDFDQLTGTMAFTPTRYKPNTPTMQGENKYVTVVQVDEYRKVNGAMVKVGHVRRDMFITVIDCGPNQNPTLSAPVANGQAMNPTDVMVVRPGTPLNFSFNSADGNANDMLTLDSDAHNELPGATFTPTAGAKPGATLSWTPTAAQARSLPYYFHVTVKDNACPVRGFRTYTYAVRVSNTGTATGIKAETVNKLSFIAFPNPFAQTVSFRVNSAGKSKNREIVIYNTLGQEVDRLPLDSRIAGEQQVVWSFSSRLPNGQYVAKLVEDRKISQTIQFTKMK